MASPTYSVLLIEDSPGDARLIREMLAEVRVVTFKLHWAERLSVGLERLRADEIDIVLLDLSLPDSQGIDTFKQVYAQASDVPIVILSGLEDEKLATKAVRMGAQDYLVKGHVTFLLLVKTIRYAIERKQAEEALRVSEERFRRTMLESPFPMMLHAEDGEVLEINKVWSELTGYAPEEIPTISAWTERAYGMQKAVVKGHIDKLFDSDTRVEEGEYVITSKAGDTLTWDFSSAPLRKLPDGRRLVLSIAKDVTKRKWAEEELKWELTVNEALSKLYKPLISPTSSIENIAKSVLDLARSLTSSEHGYVSSIAPGSGDNVCHTFTEMLKDQGQVQAKDRKIVFPRGADGLYPALWGHSLNTREAFFSNTPATHPASAGTPDSHIPITCFLSVPVLLGDELVGQIALANREGGYIQRELNAIKRLADFYALGIQRTRVHEDLQEARDKLEQRVQERTAELSRNMEALQQSETRLGDAQRMAHIGNWEWDNVKDEAWWSDEIYRIFGLNAQEFEPTYEAFLPYVHADDRELVQQSVSEAMHDHKPLNIEHRIVHPDGTERIVHLQGEVTYDGDGNPIRMMGTVQDITVRKQVEQERLKYQKQLQSLAAELTLAEEHERRTIAEGLHDQVGQLLTAANLKLEYLEGSASTPKLDQALRPIQGLIQQAIEYTRSLTFELSPPRLYALGLPAAIKWLAEQMTEDHSIRCDFSDDELPKPMSDEVQVLLYRVVRELLHNIVKHARATEAKISLITEGNNIQVCIADDGIGFDPSKIESGSDSSSGFGLFSAQERLNYLKGTLEIRSAPGGGTQAIVTVPLNPAVT